MLYRISGIVVVLGWIAATGWLVWHDILPSWTAQTPPRIVAADWVRKYGRETQFGIYDATGNRIGAIWTRYLSANTTDREDDVYLDNLPFLGPTHLAVKSIFDLDGQLDEIDINVEGAWSEDIGAPNSLQLHGERFPTEYAFRLTAGSLRRVFKVDLKRAGTFAAAIRPFDAMPNLSVGQAWRMQVFNPIAAVTGLGGEFIPMLVRVIGEEAITISGQAKQCFLVETRSAKAWVDAESGVVWRQEVSLPGGGRFAVHYEPYDESAFEYAASQFQHYREATASLDD